MTTAQHSVHDSAVDLIRGQDPAVAAILDAEGERQATTIELIASENHASPAVVAAAGTCADPTAGRCRHRVRFRIPVRLLPLLQEAFRGGPECV